MPVVTHRRAKPLLGTLVAIHANSASSDSEAVFVAATDAAFARIAHIHRVMSFHEPTSDLQAIARCRSGEHLQVDQDTWNVLQLALNIERDSDQIFNPTVAPTMVRNGLLPPPANACNAPATSTLARSICLSESCVVEVLQPVWIDLGGIAKGYAVDVATRTLIEHGVNSGIVNAGGDLCAFGNAEHRIHVRHPSNPGQRIAIANLCELSCATSGDYYVTHPKARTTAVQTAIIGVRTPRAEQHASVTVIAPLCAVADALTKVIWLAGIDSAISRTLLARYEAQSVALDVHGAATYA